MKNINILILLFLGVIITSCESDFLEPTPTSGVTSGSYFTDADEVGTAVINMYDGIQGVNSTSTNDNHAIMYEFYITEMRSDNTRTKSSEGEAAQFEDYSITATNGIVSDYYASFYNIVFRANTVLDNLGVVEDAAVAAAYEGEAKFVRAYAYFNLVRLYGDIPLVDRSLSPSEIDVQYTRVATASIYNLIVSDLQTAAANLDNSYKTRASKAAAQALLAKVHLTLGNYGDARTLCEAVVGSGFSLQSNFNDIFYNERNSEIIFAVGYAAGLDDDSQNFSSEWMNAVGRTSGVNYVTPEAVTALDDLGGDRTLYSYRIDPFQPSQNQVVKYLPNGESGGIDGKTFESDATLAGNDWIVLRYADVLLMHVEAILAGGDETADANAVASFQAVRDRAGLTDIVTSVTKQELLDERRVELAFENQRFFDLVRFGVAQDVLSAFSTANGYSFASTDLLLPIPQREVNLSNGVMTQNPGY